MSKFSEPVSIIIPGYNEEKRILPTLVCLRSYCTDHFENYEIVFVDDGSRDRTYELVKGFSASAPLGIIHLRENRGKGNAVREGMLGAKGRYRFFTDADLPYHLDCFRTAMAAFQRKHCDVVVGARDLAGSSDHAGLDLARKSAGKAFSVLANGMMKLEVGDSQCGFKGFTDRAAIEIFSRTTIRGYAFDVELLLLSRKLDLQVEKIPVKLIQKHHSKIHLLRDALHMFRDVLRLYLKQRRVQ